MRYIKLSVMTRSYDVLYDYNRSGRSFWDDLSGLLRGISSEIAIEKRGSCQCTFYLPVTEDDAETVSQVRDLITQLGSNTESFIVSSTELRDTDIERLKNSDVDHITGKSWFAAACAKAAESPAAAQQPQRQAEQPQTTEAAQTSSEQPRPQTVQTKTAQGARATAAGKDLAEESARICALRQTLLNVVHGQRHAVDEVAQTIFECDAFNSRNEERHGPLASFLFTGPSGVGKTFLAKQCAKALGVEPLVVDMSEFSDNLANMKFNGEHDQPAMVTGYVRNNPNGIIIFDEIEKAHINTIYLFLQILDAGQLMDMKLKKEVSFRDCIIFITTNAGSSLYDDPTVVDLSGVSKSVILEALRKDIKPGTNNEPYFPECITTRFANGHVILFNHLEPYALMQIIKDELCCQVELFESSYGVKVRFDADALAALVLYSTGGVADARTLRGTAKSVIVKELQDVVLQTYESCGSEVNKLKEIELSIEPDSADLEVRALFEAQSASNVLVFADSYINDKLRAVLTGSDAVYDYVDDPDELKRKARGVVDYVLVDPAAGLRPMTRTPNDLEDVDAQGVDVFFYLKEYYPELPVYFLDVRKRGDAAFSTLLAKGGRGVISVDPDRPEAVAEQLRTLAFSALVNNAAFSLGRSGKNLSYNCSQFSEDEGRAVVAFDKLSIRYAPSSLDGDVVVQPDVNGGVTFDDVVGCKEAKKALQEFCKYIADPRKLIMQGKKIPRGVLLYGPPGTGKTMLARALANEANTAFIPTTATSFFSPLVGSSEGNVRDLFSRARRYAPSIIFIDEVDAVARVRTGSIGSTYNEDVLTTLLSQMDGFVNDEKRPVFVLAATNYDVTGDGPRVLDPAFVRRFDRHIFVDLPDTDARFELLMKSLARHGVHFGDDHEKIIRNLADRSSGMSNADLTTVVSLFLRSVEDTEPSAAALMDALDTFRFGEINEMDPADLRQTACHESGHALVARLLGEMPSYLTIVARSNFGGFMEHAHDDKKLTISYNELMARVCCALAGRAAEIEVYGSDAGVNTGASADLRNARFIIKNALNEYAMGEKLYTAGTDEECEKLMQEQFDRTRKLIAEHRDVLEALTDYLMDRKSLNQAELTAFFAEHLPAD